MTKFFAFEGVDGAGKSTQAGLFYQYLLSKGMKAILTREPGGTILSEKLRAILLNEEEIADPLTELLILNAARRDHIENFIKPKLAAGQIVICDRFLGSTIAYQGYLKGFSIDKIKKLHQIATDNFFPDLTFVFDVSPQIAESRLKSRANNKNHYDKITMGMREKIRQSFNNLENVMPSKVVIIDAIGDVDTVAAEVVKAYGGFCKSGS